MTSGVITFLAVGLLGHFLQRVRPVADFTQTRFCLRAVSLACHGVQDDHRKLPPAFGPRAEWISLPPFLFT